MKILRFNSEFEIFDALIELPTSQQKLMLEAEEAVKSAYAPYSRFQVGAAVLLENGTVIKGNNQENAAYPSGLCAERVALFSASAQHPKLKIVAVAVAGAAHADAEHVLSPCGACRQALAEYETKFNSPITLLMHGEKGKMYRSQSVNNLLPLMFNNKNLK